MPDWNVVYASKEVAESNPAEVLINNVHLLSGKGKALDYASGLAGNAKLLEATGYQVSAWDSSEVAVQKVNNYAQVNKLNIQAEYKDLENPESDPENFFDVIVVSYFLCRERLRDLAGLLNKNGLLFYQTFSGEQIEGVGPSRADFRLRRGELMEVFSDMELLFYREDIPVGSASIPDQVYFVAKK